MNKPANVALSGLLLPVVGLLLVVPIAASIGTVALLAMLAIVAAVTWMAAVHSAIAGRRTERAVTRRVGARRRR